MLILLPGYQINLVWHTLCVWGQCHKEGQGHTKVKVIPRSNCKCLTFNWQVGGGPSTERHSCFQFFFDQSPFCGTTDFSHFGLRVIFPRVVLFSTLTCFHVVTSGTFSSIGVNTVHLKACKQQVRLPYILMQFVTSQMLM